MSGHVLVSQDLRKLHEAGCISNVTCFDTQVQPASFDLYLGDCGYLVNSSFLPGPENTVEEHLHHHTAKKIEIKQDTLLKRGQVYILLLRERLALPKSLYGLFNPKSSTGRLDIFARSVCDYADRFDYAPPGYKGPLYVEIYSSSFDIIVSPGIALNQLRVQHGTQIQLSREEMHNLRLMKLHENADQMDHYDNERGLIFSLSLSNGEGPVGYRSKIGSGAINLRYINHYSVNEFWDPVYAKNGEIVIEPEGFYILKSHNNAFVPTHCAGHMLPYDIEAGEFRVHYAGFFDPGFGCSEMNGANSKAIMEVRCRDVPFLLREGQIVGRLIYQRLSAIPDILYGTEKSNYQGQQLRLSKHFKQ